MRIRSVCLAWMCMAVGVALAEAPAEARADSIPRTLSFERRVQAQEAIERVYYRHQIGATAPFEQAVPRALLEKKVRDYLDESAALEKYWDLSVTDDMLERELERMARGTRMPERLLELYAALDNDSFLVKECLARPLLVDRLVRSFYVNDRALHVRERAQARDLRGRLASGDLDPSSPFPNRSVAEMPIGASGDDRSAPEERSCARLTAEQFGERRAKLPARSGRVSEVRETAEGFAVQVVVRETPTVLRLACYEVPKTDWDAWWPEARRAVSGAAVSTRAAEGQSLPLPASASPPTSGRAACADFDTWDNGSLDDVPDPRDGYSAVWTGTLMLVWGGGLGTGQLDSGARYDPATDSWTPMSRTGAPAARLLHSAVWTGREMLVWGGTQHNPPPQPGAYLATGGRYDPATDTWAPMSAVDAPSPRAGHAAVWTGREMVVWGGRFQDNGGTYWPNTGGRYDPASDSWTATTVVGAPDGRADFTTIWTGEMMVIWGGDGGVFQSSTTNTGGRYDPATDTWLPTSVIDAPSARAFHSAVWTGSRMIIWGGDLSLYQLSTNTGGRYDPATDSWTPTSTTNAPTPRAAHSAVWTGTEVIVWGGRDASSLHERLDSGGHYDPATDAWTPTAQEGAPSPRQSTAALWTGSLMIVWGGQGDYALLNTGGRYDPASRHWTPTSTATAPSARQGHSAVWTGTRMVVWGGGTFTAYVDTGGRYDPATDSWSPTSTSGAPSARGGHTAVWTGAEMLVWGGFDATDDGLNTGGRYDPVADTWLPTATMGAPSARARATAVWTGRSMVIWGGSHLDSVTHVKSYFDTGGRYDPIADAWAPTSTSGTPSARDLHTAVWTGRVMVVWGGGRDGQYPVNSGGRYDPEADAWTATSTEGAPRRRRNHTAVWTGGLMVVWGGTDGVNNEFYLDSGGRYDPTTDAWSATSSVGAPGARAYDTAVWTGREMIVWGGMFFDGYPTVFDDGARYDPAADRWSPMSTTGAASSRWNHAAVWTGSVMIVWGGWNGAYLSSGGRYQLREADRCDDGNPCTDDACDPQTGCVFTDNTAPCSNGNACTIDTCHEGTCVTGPLVDCDDSNPCTTDSCDPATGCAHVDNVDPCDDGFACTQNDTCQNGQCRGTPTWGTHCDDGNPCTTEDACYGYYCIGGPWRNCDDLNPCTDDACDPERGGCIHLNDDANPCSDGDLCTVGDVCRSGTCAVEPVHCVGGCPPGFAVVGGLCRRTYVVDAGLLDNQGQFCDAARKNRYTCQGATYGFHWTDLGVSLAGVTGVDIEFVSGFACAAGSRTVTLNGVPVASVQVGDSCLCDPPLRTVSVHGIDPSIYVQSGLNTISIARGTCGGLSATDNLDNGFARVTVTYTPLNPCLAGACDPGTGTCSFAPVADGSACHGDACTGAGTCLGGSCVPNENVCDDGNPCTVDTCDLDAGCAHAPRDGPCDDGNACTTDDTCRGGICVPGGPTDCDDGDCCTVDACDPSMGCYHTPNTTPPVFTNQPSLGDTVLWPPEHGYADFTLGGTGVAASAACGIASIRFASCHSSQPENGTGTGDGNTLRDCVYEPEALHLRAERDGACSPIGRAYEMTVVAIDACGNSAVSEPFDVGVWHDRGTSPPAGQVVGATDGSGKKDTRNGVNGTYGVDCGVGDANPNGSVPDRTDTDPEMEISQAASIDVDDLHVDKVGADVELTWSAPAQSSLVTRYHVYRRDPVTGSWALLAEVGRDTTSYRDSVLNEAHAWHYKVAAVVK